VQNRSDPGHHEVGGLDRGDHAFELR
jgi:hypothetical protein